MDQAISAAVHAALEHHKSGRFADAEQGYRRILDEDPRNVQVHNLLGALLGQTGRLDMAVEILRHAQGIDPGNPHTQNNLGTALKNLGQVDEAIDCFSLACRLNPSDASAFSNLGAALYDRGRAGDAIEACRQAIALQPDLPQAHANLANALKVELQLDQAIAEFEKAIKLNPGNPEFYSNLASTLVEASRYDQAITAYRKAIAINPTAAAYYSNLGVAYLETSAMHDAVAAFRQAVQMDPKLDVAHSNLVQSMNYLSEFSDAQIAAEALKWGRLHGSAEARVRQLPQRDLSPDRRLRVGYVSPDFSRHPVAFFFRNLLENHEPSAVETYCYADLKRQDELTACLRAAADHWRDSTGWPHAQLADAIVADRIDILVDLAGHTAGNRLRVFALKPAPVQISYLGYPNTTGLSAIDYRLTDAYVDPPGSVDGDYSERLVRLPDTFLCFRPADVPLPSRPERPVRFGSFNALQKTDVMIVEIWAELLKQVPQSTLVLKSFGLASNSGRQTVSERFAAFGIGVDRLDLLPPVGSQQQHLNRYAEIDIALDSYPYHGTTTTCEAMWMGAPVVTLAGESHRSRVGISLLSNVGLQELIAESPADYVRIAAGLAADKPRLESIRASLRDRMNSNPLTDGPAYARNVEAAYRRFWRQWIAEQ